jgi:hypothetical protein
MTPQNKKLKCSLTWCKVRISPRFRKEKGLKIFMGFYNLLSNRQINNASLFFLNDVTEILKKEVPGYLLKRVSVMVYLLKGANLQERNLKTAGGHNYAQTKLVHDY